MSRIRIVPLGAGQDVGRSCILVSIGGRNVMLDCGMHMGYDDKRRFPNFDFISPSTNLTDAIDCVIISHLYDCFITQPDTHGGITLNLSDHLDHCGALPYFSEMRGYDGPIFMTHPTKAVCPVLLEDYRKVTVERYGVKDFFSSEHIRSCMSKVTAVNVHETVKVDEELEITPYYAGHVLGAAMFLVRCGDQSVLYTGDYNMTPDRHLGAARVPRLCPDVIISESTYATTIRDSKRLRERDILQQIHECVDGGGKVLVPVFALGRAQELFILIETYWERMNLQVPVYFTAGIASKANQFYKLFVNWTNQKIKQTFVRRNMFDFSHIKPFQRSYAFQPGPMVVFATPGMLHAGQSLEIFKQWCGDPRNLVILPGYCVAGTVGNKILAGQKRVSVDRATTVDVHCRVSKVSFSAHADAKGILQLIRQTQPRNVVLVHGEMEKMNVLQDQIEQEFNIACKFPANGSTVTFEASGRIPIDICSELLQGLEIDKFDKHDVCPDDTIRSKLVNGVVVMHPNKGIRLLPAKSLLNELGVRRHRIHFSTSQALPPGIETGSITTSIGNRLRAALPQLDVFVQGNVNGSDCVRLRSICIELVLSTSAPSVRIGWEHEDDAVARQARSIVQSTVQEIAARAT